MSENISNVIIVSLFIGIGGLAMLAGIIRFVKRRYAPVKTVPAVVADKQKAEAFSKYSGNGKREKYVIVFWVNGRKMSFYVSPFSYNGYRVSEAGLLTYKGDKIISFRENLGSNGKKI